MEVVNQGNESVSSGKGGESLNSMLNEILSGSEAQAAPEPQHNDMLDAGLAKANAERQVPSAQEVADEIEYEGKKYKVEKKAADYLKSELDAKKGMRKAFSERDQIKKQMEEISKKSSKWDQIESVFKEKGIQGLFDALAGEDGAYTKHEQKLIERAIRKYNATSDELKILEQEEAMERDRQRAETAEKLLREQQEKIQAEKEAANREVLEGKILTAHEKVSFAGKLGDEAKEKKFDSYVWERVRMRLNEYVQDKKIDAHMVPGKVVNALFEEEAADFADAFKTQIEASTKAALSKQSDAATLAAQAKTVSGVSTAPRNLEQLADENKGSITATLRALFGRPV